MHKGRLFVLYAEVSPAFNLLLVADDRSKVDGCIECRLAGCERNQQHNDQEGWYRKGEESGAGSGQATGQPGMADGLKGRHCIAQLRVNTAWLVNSRPILTQENHSHDRAGGVRR